MRTTPPRDRPAAPGAEYHNDLPEPRADQPIDASPPAHDGIDPHAIADSVRWRVVLLCALVCFLDGYDMITAPVSVPLLATDWELPPAAFATALAAAVLGTGLGSAFIAPLGDRYGRRPLILGSFALVGLTSLLVPLCESLYGLTLLRFATGLGLGASLSNAVALTSEYALPRLRSRIITCVYAMSALGGAFGGFVAPSLLAAWHWPGVYVFGGLVPLALLPVLYAGLAESRHFLALGDTATTTSVRGQLGALFSREYRASTGLLWALFFLCTFCTYVISSWLPTLLSLSGWSLDNAVRAVTLFSFGGVFGGVMLGWMVDRGRVITALLAGFGTAACALASLHLVPASVGTWMLLIALLGAGNIGVAYGLTAFAAIVYPTALRASGIGAAGACGRFGATLAPLAGGWLLARDIPALHILTGLIVPASVALLLVLASARRFRVAPAS